MMEPGWDLSDMVPFVKDDPGFRGGAQAIVKCGGVLLKIEVHGKNMFYFFGKAGGDPSVSEAHLKLNCF